MLKILSSETGWIGVLAMLSGVAVLVPSLVALVLALHAAIDALL